MSASWTLAPCCTRLAPPRRRARLKATIAPLGGFPTWRSTSARSSLRLGDTPLSRLTGSIEYRDGVWRYAALRAQVEGSDVRLDLDSRWPGSALLAATDAGWRSERRQLRSRYSRWTILLVGRSESSSGRAERPRQFGVHHFTLRGAPTIARILSLASFSGLGQALTGGGLAMDGLVVPFWVQGDVIRVDKARLVGSNIGARADGTIDLARQRVDLSGTVAPLCAQSNVGPNPVARADDVRQPLGRGTGRNLHGAGADRRA